jgi:hypothetical protein
MHDIEPHFNWRHIYAAEEDENSPFFEQEYSEFEFSHQVYNYFIHPQWDCMGSQTLYLKILFADYEEGFCIIELIGEWNDCIGNDIMIFKREICEKLMSYGIFKFVLIGENVLNFHFGDDEYYMEWKEELAEKNGWITCIGFLPHVVHEFYKTGLSEVLENNEDLDEINWRGLTPSQLYQVIEKKKEDKGLISLHE